MKPLVIYHADCTDGYGAAFAAWMSLGNEAEYVPMNYIKKWTDTEVIYQQDFIGRDVYILDFSFPHGLMMDILDVAKRVVWLDHHKTAFEMWCGEYTKGMIWVDDNDQHNDIVLDDTKSGALLAWEYFHPGTEVPMLIQHIDDRDRWQWKLPGTAELHAALSSYQPWSFEQWASWLKRGIDGMHNEQYDLFNEGTAILRAQKQHIERMVKQARKCSIATETKLGAPLTEPFPVFHGLAVNASLHQSEVGHELANASGTYGLVYYIADNNRVRCSLRSNGDYDVSAIAATFGGGGHRNAAGFETDIETLMAWLK